MQPAAMGILLLILLTIVATGVFSFSFVYHWEKFAYNEHAVVIAKLVYSVVTILLLIAFVISAITAMLA